MGIWGCENEDYWIGNRKWGMGKVDEQLNSRTSEPFSNLEREALNLEREAIEQSKHLQHNPPKSPTN